MGGGYCFVNNVAVAAHWLVSHPGASTDAGRVAILDIDFHHGNGTQAIFYERSDVLFVSLHADPDRQYPYFLGGADERGAGEGVGFNINYPLPIGIEDDPYLAFLDRACDDVSRFAPHYLLVSLGVDTFGSDPLGDFALTNAAFPRIGARLAQLHLPTVFLMEGGYAIDQLGSNVVGVLAEFDRHSRS
jgi:acetoin utilization deacetylase AcuC-like enzyme